MFEAKIDYAKCPFSEIVPGKIQATEHGALINGRHYPRVIGFFGGGTGFEALVAAQKDPKAAILVIDPLVRFGQKVIDQLSTGKQKIDWTFFNNDLELRRGLEVLSMVFDEIPELWAQLTKNYSLMRNVAQNARDRIYWIPLSTKNILPEPLLDEAQFIYPKQTSLLDTSIYRALAGSVRPGGKIHVITDSVLLYRGMCAMGDGQIQTHGRVKRHGKVIHPQSAYDIVFRPEGYYFIDIKVEKPILPPNRMTLLLAATAFSLLNVSKTLPPNQTIQEK